MAYVLLIGQTAEKFSALCLAAGVNYSIVPSLHEAVEMAYQQAKILDKKIVLFSPGAASFDMFKNVYHRVEEFVKEVNLLS